MAEEGRKVVIGMDGSKNSSFAFDWYLKNIHRPKDHVILVHSPEYHSLGQSSFAIANLGHVAEQVEEEQKKAQEFNDNLVSKLKEAGIGGEVKTVGGFPGEALVKTAENEEASLIVTGTRGLGTIRRTLLGSVSDFVMRHSHIPVTVCREKPE
ncbi:universal stress protein YxiE-like [Gigantopelta aegis]|uniref:universal stress protein YxiE-like n=1 Tax=Gigantopelta aegis TaxID=1735272 RepID=UPI001B88C61F|nr:universal stress protein YxiE-like [Gigantopelta aegis]